MLRAGAGIPGNSCCIPGNRTNVVLLPSNVYGCIIYLRPERMQSIEPMPSHVECLYRSPPFLDWDVEGLGLESGPQEPRNRGKGTQSDFRHGGSGMFFQEVAREGGEDLPCSNAKQVNFSLGDIVFAAILQARMRLRCMRAPNAACVWPSYENTAQKTSCAILLGKFNKDTIHNA